jgi:lipopolysaccharide biosynthesis glycosyltransferase
VIRAFVGYDKREAVAYSVFCHSVLARSSEPVSFTPVTYKQRDGTNAFIYGRFLAPYYCGFKGWALFADGDMLCRDDIAKLWALRDKTKAVQVVQHDYATKHPVKYLGQKNDDYPRKNWSSLMLMNCEAWEGITPNYVDGASGSHLHRFGMFADEEVGALPITWNWLVREYPHNDDAKIAHFTIGAPCWQDYANDDYADEWFKEKNQMLNYQQYVRAA